LFAGARPEAIAAGRADASPLRSEIPFLFDSLWPIDAAMIFPPDRAALQPGSLGGLLKGLNVPDGDCRQPHMP
jgi:hypothetical protein